jgi:hypothetical protein
VCIVSGGHVNAVCACYLIRYQLCRRMEVQAIDLNQRHAEDAKALL